MKVGPCHDFAVLSAWIFAYTCKWNAQGYGRSGRINGIHRQGKSNAERGLALNGEEGMQEDVPFKMRKHTSQTCNLMLSDLPPTAHALLF